MRPDVAAAAAPRWRGEPGRLEVWYATLSDPVTRSAIWLHHEIVAPTSRRRPYAHGWLTWFPADGPPRTDRFGPHPVSAPTDGPWFAAGGVCADAHRFAGRAGALSWDIDYADASAPLWTFGRVAWRRELLPGAQVVVAPAARFTGRVDIAATGQRLDGWRGAVAHIYGHGNAARWGWIHADLGGGDVLEVVTAVSRKPVLRSLPPVAFARLRVDGHDWPAAGGPALRLRTTLGLPHWQLEGRVRGRDVLIRVDQPPQRCVALRYVDPDGSTAVCTNTEQADVHVELRGGGRPRRAWSVLGAGHAEVGLRGADAPPIDERTSR